jgi:hypothetical protein
MGDLPTLKVGWSSTVVKKGEKWFLITAHSGSGLQVLSQKARSGPYAGNRSGRSEISPCCNIPAAPPV